MRRWMIGFVVVALAAAPAFAGKYNKVISVGEKAPGFDAIPAVMVDKETSLSLGDLKEDVVVVAFLANHCHVVVAYEDRIIDFANKFKGKSVKVVGLCVNDLDSDRLPAIKERVKDKGYNFVYGYDASQKVGRAYGAVATPQFFVLDKERVIRYTGAMDDNNAEGKVTKHFLEAAVNAVLAGESPEVAETLARGCSVKYTK